MSRSPTFNRINMPIVWARLSDLIAREDRSFPLVLRLPKPSEGANRLVSFILATQMPVVAPRDANGFRRVLANLSTVALVRALLSNEQRRRLSVRCVEWKGAESNCPAIDPPSALLDLMVSPPRTPPTRKRLSDLQKNHGVILRRRKPSALDDLVPSRPRKARAKKARSKKSPADQSP